MRTATVFSSWLVVAFTGALTASCAATRSEPPEQQGESAAPQAVGLVSEEPPAPAPEDAAAREREARRDQEIETVKRRIEVLRWGVEVFVENGRNDLAEQLELAEHARKMAIAGRRDAEAREVRERAPSQGRLAELLHAAGSLYERKGWETRAARCFELSQVYGHQWRERDARRGEERRERETAAWQRRTGETLERFMERVELLEVHVQKLVERLERLEEAEKARR